MEFAGAVDAVLGANEIQGAMAERNSALPEDRRIEFRIGVIDEEIYSDGVNVAARIEPL
jgi:adenylate cyclase